MLSRRKAREESEQDFELNITSIIDCFTVLIAFLLISSSFVSIGILDAEVAAGAPIQQQDSNPKATAQIELKPDHTIVLSQGGRPESARRISPNARGAWDYEALQAQLAQLKAEVRELGSATVVASESVQYRDVVRSMEVARTATPNVNLGGF